MKFIQNLIIILIVIFGICSNSKAQTIVLDSLHTSDTLKIKSLKIHSPKKATLFSTAVPGLGQIYNKKYWKVPIIYGGIITSFYLAFSNNTNFKKFKTAYGLRVDGDVSTVDDYVGVISDEGLKLNMNYYQRNRDLSFIVTGLIYVLNIVDAAVDAHLYNFPKNDNLSFTLQPTLELTTNNRVSKGFRLIINL